MEEEFQTGYDVYPEYVEDDVEKLGTVPVETVCKEHEGERIVEEDSNTTPTEEPAIEGNACMACITKQREFERIR